jgi:hypothetical protein
MATPTSWALDLRSEQRTINIWAVFKAYPKNWVWENGKEVDTWHRGGMMHIL